MFAPSRLVLVVLSVALIAAAAHADRLPSGALPARDPVIIHGGSATPAKAGRDTLMLMGPTGSGAPYIGDFESGTKALDPADPRTHGWTSRDLTQPTTSQWPVSDFTWSDVAELPGYAPISGAYSAWCGDPAIPSCDGVLDPTGGYGSSWNEILEFRASVDDPTRSCALTITGNAVVSSEPGYDGTGLRVEKSDWGFVDVNYWDGIQTVAISEYVTYQPGEYVGYAADEIVVLFQFESDGGWDDSDCSFPSAGAFILDNVVITSDNGASTGGVVNFEGGSFDGTPFRTRMPLGVGDFAKIWSHLQDADRCGSNYSNQVAFIDDGVVVPGTGGTPCYSWCYGPGGYVVNATGGLAKWRDHIHNAIESPPMVWGDPTHRGALLSFDVYRHEELGPESAGIFYTWSVRTVATGDPADLEQAVWADRNFVYYGGPDYLRVQQVVDDLLVPDPTHAQIQLTVYELGWVWGWCGFESTPAPYFDNVRFETYPVVGPRLATREIDLAQDNFPASGTIDMSDPRLLSVHFDGSQDISPPSHNRPAVADSICFDAVATRPGSILDPATPTLNYKVRRNPVFDPFRTSALPAEGTVPCEQVTSASGLPVPNRYFGDLDDEGFLFPGDVVHYYISATDRDTTDDSTEMSILPADTTGYSVFDDPMAYDPSFTVHCLPTIHDLTGSQTGILFWNDAGNRGGRDEWYSAFANTGYHHADGSWFSYDIYYTNGPSSGVGNGLGGRATPLQMRNYGTVLYTSGDLGSHTISNGYVAGDSGADAELLMAWFDQDSRSMLATGDNLASDLAESGPATSTLLRDYFQVDVLDPDIRDLIDGQSAPVVRRIEGDWLLAFVDSWIAYGGCPGLNTFDAVIPTGIAERRAVWTNSAGVDGGYPYSAMTTARGSGPLGTALVISLPYGFSHIHTDPNEDRPQSVHYPLSARARILASLQCYMQWCGPVLEISGADLPGNGPFSARHHPNPFNPVVRLSFTVPRPGRLTVKVYDVRGRLVRTLFDEQVTGATDLAWNGKDDQGADTASGVYFYEARMHGDVQVGKLTLVR